MFDDKRLLRSLNPASVAVVGGREAERVVRQCRKLGFDGPIWPVNPRREILAELPCYAALADLPGAPDATFIAVPADASIEIVHQLAQSDAGGAVCYASGFRESGRLGAARQARLLAAAQAMPVLGPNCYGYINALCGAALWPDQHGLVRRSSGVAIISASGNIGLNLTLQQRSVPIAQLITVGNQAVVGVEACLAVALETPGITAVGLHIEGLSDLPRFIQAAERARQRGIAIVVLKSGRTATGARITFSHTATLAGPPQLYDALFERLNIAQVFDLEVFLEALKLLSISGALPGNRIASISCSGGEASLMADLSAAAALQFPPLAEAHKQQVQATLSAEVNVDNPLDYHTFIWGDEARLRRMFTAMLQGDFDLTVLVLDFPAVNQCDITAWQQALRAFITAAQQTGARAAVLASLSENMPAAERETLANCGVAPLLGMRQALAAIAAASRVGLGWRAGGDAPLLPRAGSGALCSTAVGAAVSGLDEAAAKAWLRRAGLDIPPSRVAASVEQAVAAARELGFPVAVKVLSDRLSHKTDVGGVALGLADAPSLAAATGDILRLAGRVLVEQMVDNPVVELLVGVNCDALFGHYLIIGAGGIGVELARDHQIVLLPASREMIYAALDKLALAPMLNGYRGREKADKAAVVDAVMRVIELVNTTADRLVELEINPLMVQPEGGKAIAADALIRVASGAEPSILPEQEHDR